MHVVHSLHTGGMENGVVNLINRMDWERFHHSVCCIATSGEMEERVLRKDVKVFEMKKGAGHSFTLPLRLAALFRRERVDIVHTRNWGTIDGILGARMSLISKVIHGEHGWEVFDPEGLNKKRNILRKMLSPFVSRYVTVSQDLKKWLVEVVGIRSNKIATIINGVDTEKFIPKKNSEETSNALGYKQDEIIIGAVGRLDPVKDYKTLIKAFISLSNSFRNIRLMVIGNGAEDVVLKKLVTQAGIKDRVAFMGMRNDTPELFRCMDVFVLPSVAEGISNTILEAMASGLPVIATDIGGNPELVRDQETGFLFPSGDVGCLSTLLKKYIVQPQLRFLNGGAGRMRALEDFSLNTMVKSYEGLYMSL